MRAAECLAGNSCGRSEVDCHHSKRTNGYAAARGSERRRSLRPVHVDLDDARASTGDPIAERLLIDVNSRCQPGQLFVPLDESLGNLCMDGVRSRRLLNLLQQLVGSSEVARFDHRGELLGIGSGSCSPEANQRHRRDADHQQLERESRFHVTRCSLLRDCGQPLHQQRRFALP